MIQPLCRNVARQSFTFEYDGAMKRAGDSANEHESKTETARLPIVARDPPLGSKDQKQNWASLDERC